MITLSLDKPFAGAKPSSSSASVPVAAAPKASSPSTPKASPAKAAAPPPALTKEELKTAGKSARKFGLGWLQFGRVRKRLQTLETVSLGDKRFIALVRVDERQFLIGGAPSSVGLLTELAHEESFQQVLTEATRGMNVSLTPVAPVSDQALAFEKAAALPLTEAGVPEPALDPADSPAATVAISSRAATETRLSSPATMFAAPVQAYRENASFAAVADAPVASAVSAFVSPPAENAQAVLPQATAAIDASSLQPLPAIPAMPQPVPDILVAREPVESAPMQTAAEAVSAPSFTFQTWPAPAPKKPARQNPPAPSKPAFQMAAFTWSLTGAAS